MTSLQYKIDLLSIFIKVYDFFHEVHSIKLVLSEMLKVSGPISFWITLHNIETGLSIYFDKYIHLKVT